MNCDEQSTVSRGLGDPADARSNCGVGVVMDLDGVGSSRIVRDSLTLLENMEHRGTTGAESNTGDGAGIMLQMPHEFFAAVLGDDLPNRGNYAVGTLFFPQNDQARNALKSLLEEKLASEGLEVLTWRAVPTENDGLGATALDSEPVVEQVFVTPSPDASEVTDEEFDRRLYVGRRVVENAVARQQPLGHNSFYVVSLDRKTVVYKGLLTASQLTGYYPDLTDERMQSIFALVHARFSTNTLGAWHLAHPFRTMVHNGEINTIRGNINWMRSRETDIAHDSFGRDIEKVKPIIDDLEQSDTASVDNVLELLLEGGRSLPHSLRMLIPEAWRGEQIDIEEERQAFYDYHASLLEPWDGPALVAATDGERVGAVLDRNGLRPCRYDVLSDDTLVMASEVGALPYDESDIVRRGRLQPGQCFVADPTEGRIIPDSDVFDEITNDRYGSWVDSQQRRLDDIDTGINSDEQDSDDSRGPQWNSSDSEPQGGEAESQVGDSEPRVGTSELRIDDTELRVGESLRARQAMYGYTYDEMDQLLEPMATTGKDPVGSMGDDTPLSVLSQFNRPLFSYFKQLFAQVSNPPLDYIREELVTSLETRLGPQRNLLDESPAHARQLVLDSPVLTVAELDRVKSSGGADFSSTVVDMTYDPGRKDLESAVEAVREAASEAATDHDIVVLSDRRAGTDRVPVPSLLAVGGVHHHLVRNGQRNHVGLVVESGDPRAVHHFATLFGYGAGAVCPYLAYESIADLVAGPDGATVDEAIDAYIGAIESGLLKTMAKMGISTVESYRGAQIFEAVGLDSAFVEEYFERTTNRTGGIDITDVERDLRNRHSIAWESDDPDIERIGEYENRTDGIYHQWNPETVRTLQQAVRRGEYETYREFAGLVNEQNEQLATLRGLLTFNDEGREPVPIDAVEPVESIVERFETAAMSLGSISPEMHETNAIAMNRLGGKANTGEGGEPAARFGTEKNCHTKQVASGRFGVTSAYLTAADEIQIKMAQGSKPGEGGHLPGDKVNEMIAEVRHATPGVGLISPPPQHDIYSIEDLKQLIHDLKSANPDADISVKLVAEAGVGIVAAGVAKANADVVHISGHSGGTGASPKTSIKNAGVPWELGLAEANQLLCETGLRDRIRVTTDGGMKTGRDVAIAALLGAEGYVFGTGSLVTSGCVMARQCHENTCPVGIATQDEDLRDRFPGEPQHVVNYMTFIAQELREIMASLGFESLDKMIGRAEVLDQRSDITHEKASNLDLSGLLVEPERKADTDRFKTTEQDHEIDANLDWEILDQLEAPVGAGKPVTLDMDVENTDRAVGAILSNRISAQYGVDGLPEDSITLRFDGTAGQSFGAFLQNGVTMTLVGSANDYLGKGLSGGKLVVRTPNDAGYDASENIVTGNVALYGATAGECYVNGAAGERFAVRNSGVKGVVESVGDHGCEYMTGGAIVVLGETGTNFGAGMSGGVAYVYDPDGSLQDRVNTEMVSLSETLDTRDRELLARLVDNHAKYTGSDRALELLENWGTERENFTRVLPDPYAAVLEESAGSDVRTELPPSATLPADESLRGIQSGAD